MNFAGLFCFALLLATSAVAQPSASPAIQPAAQAVPKPNSPMSEIKVECVPAARAAELLDKHGCVVGKVFQVTSPKDGSARISLCSPKSDCSFHAVVFASDRDNVGDLSYLRGKLVAFVGDITNYRGNPEIVVKDRRQIRVASGDPPPQFDAAQSKPTSSGQSRGGTRTRAW